MAEWRIFTQFPSLLGVGVTWRQSQHGRKKTLSPLPTPSQKLDIKTLLGTGNQYYLGELDITYKVSFCHYHNNIAPPGPGEVSVLTEVCNVSVMCTPA